ncbi:MAG: ABC transporter substrate-binding protein [Alphaproteobacteria bacterium]|nr:ABC transporter substrate-binding protein [Alphaproteobacteria bacterium]
MVALVTVSLSAGAALAQKPGGTLRAGHFDSPASMSLLEESTLAANRPMMAVFNNLVMYDQHVPQNSTKSIVPDLAAGWSWNEEGTAVTFTLHRGVKWHDGSPFTAADVKCTFDLLLDKAEEKLRINPRKAWYGNLAQVAANGDFEVTFHLKRPQPSFLALLATGWSPIYPCHVSPREMRTHPIGTGPFKFVEFKPNEVIRVIRNPDYWKSGRPYLDAIEWTIVKDPATRLLQFFAGQSDVYFGVSIPQLADVATRIPQAICDVFPVNGSRNLIVNRGGPPFDNPELRRAMSLALDRKAFIGIMNGGRGQPGGAMQPPPEGLWGMPPERLASLPGYGPDVAKSRAEAQSLMQGLGYGPDKRLSVKVAARNVPAWRDPEVILIDQLKHIYIDGELELVDTPQWYPKLLRKDYKVGLNVTESEVDDPDAQFYENYACSSKRNVSGYCNPEVDRLIDQQSMASDVDKRRQLVWQIQQKLIEDDARPDIFYAWGANCRQPYVKGLISMVNSIYNGARFEDLWLDK